jgi:serine/threonine-protein kinase
MSEPHTAATSRLPVREGEILEGQYRIVRVLGQGGMGCVFLAMHVHLEIPVAIKFLMDATSREAERRFIREASITANLKSRHVVRVNSVGRHNEALYIVMEYLDGEDLSALLKRAGPLPIESAVGHILEACEALALAHAAGVVHRDVKPSNLMLTRRGIKVLDFGVSKVTAARVSGTLPGRLTTTSEFIGSPIYMAPEQINNAANVDGRADIWSIGVVLYQLLSGATPWMADTVLGLFSIMAKQPPKPITEYRCDVPAGLAAIIEQCLEKDRERRWPSIAAFAAALAPYGPRSAAEIVERIAECQDVPGVQAARPTEPMPASGAASTFGWVASETAPAESAAPPLVSTSPLASQPSAAPALGAAPLPVPARTSRAVDSAPPVRRVALVVGGAVAVALFSAAFVIVLVPAAPAPVASSLPTTTAAPAPVASSPLVTAASSSATTTAPLASSSPSPVAPAASLASSSPAPVASSSPATTARPKAPLVQRPIAARQTEAPGGSRQ